ncbi:MAG TPA: Flp pilus assembly protein CpaB [Coleofasciculaceae cyanobacterium]|jgi:Flp pilus assembly protein CpaB
MPAPRKPKKVLIQFAIALVVAAVLGIGAVIAGFSVIMSINDGATKAQEEAKQAAAEAKAELDRIKKQNEKPVVEAPQEFEIVQAVGEIKQGEPITQGKLTKLTVKERPMPGTIENLSQAVGKISKVRIIEGEILNMSKLIDSSSMLNVDTGMRAITINVDNIGSLNGALMPGMRVDVLATVKQDEKVVTRTMLQNIQVIGVGSGGAAAGPAMPTMPAALSSKIPAQVSAPSGGGAASAVTFLVSPKQAELLSLANQTSQIHLTLRNYGDKQVTKVMGADVSVLMTGIESDTVKKSLPNMPFPPGDSGFHNVNYAPGGNLPNPPDAVGSSKNKFSMRIYRGTGAETVDFEQ